MHCVAGMAIVDGAAHYGRDGDAAGGPEPEIRNPKPEIRKKAETRIPNPNRRLQHFPTSGGPSCPLNTLKDAKRDTDFTNFHGWTPEFIFVSFFSVFSGHPVLLSDYFFRL